jgi:hypothetical protein
MDGNATVAVLCLEVDEAVGSASSSCSEWVAKGDDSSPVHGGSSMDDFKVACIFTKVECVEYVYSSVTIGLEL